MSTLEAPAPSSQSANLDARSTYVERLTHHRTTVDRLDRLDDRFAIGRLAVAGAFAVYLYVYFTGSHVGGPCAVLALLSFVALTFYHGKIADSLTRARRLVAFYEAGMRRIDGGWEGKGSDGDRYVDPQHPYTADVDIFGDGSIFELLCAARTISGEDCLAGILSTTCDAETARRRQQAVQELAPRLDLREDIALLGQEVRSRIKPEGLAAWGTQPAQLTSIPVRIGAVVVTVLTVAAAVAWGTHATSYWFLLVLFLIGRVLEYSIRKPLASVVKAVQKTSAEFEFLASILARIEKERFSSLELVRLHDQLRRDGLTASTRIRRLSSLIGYLDANLNQFFAMISPFLLWTVHCAFAIEGWRIRNGGEIGKWIDVIGQFEAYASIAGYAYEHAEQPYPEILDADASVYVDARQIGHPLIPADKVVRNDIAITGTARLYIVSGSNMSGKSTLLRTIGVNAILAMAGAPVRAESLRFQPRSIGTSITTHDSLHGGVSRFYAEIQRLRQIVDLAASGPTLFLLDEVLHGTNSHDRRIGAEAILRSLVASGAVGLATTHDLAIARIATDPVLAAVNVHLEDQLVDGRMSFDYRLREGVVEKSNALALMRAVGLDV